MKPIPVSQPTDQQSASCRLHRLLTSPLCVRLCRRRRGSAIGMRSDLLGRPVLSLSSTGADTLLPPRWRPSRRRIERDATDTARRPGRHYTSFAPRSKTRPSKRESSRGSGQPQPPQQQQQLLKAEALSTTSPRYQGTLSYPIPSTSSICPAYDILPMMKSGSDNLCLFAHCCPARRCITTMAFELNQLAVRPLRLSVGFATKPCVASELGA